MSHSAKSSLLRAFLAAACACAAGCVESPSGGGPQRFRIPWPNEGPNAAGVYSEQNVEIATFDHPESLYGKWARILVSAGIAGNELVGGPAIGRYVRGEDGVLWPADLRTREATVIYAHFERLRAMDEEIGAANLIPWPATISIQTAMRGLVPGQSDNNAFFDCGYRALFNLPYSAALPVSMNAGVLAHEHAHAAFCAVVLAPIAAQIGRFPRIDTSGGDGGSLSDLILRGINEGYSDVRAWAYAGDPNFLAASLPQQADQRRLDAKASKIGNIEMWNAILAAIRREPMPEEKKDRLALQVAYELGTQTARSIFQLVVAAEGAAAPSRPARIQAARALVEALPVIAHAAGIAYANKTTIEPNLGVTAFAQMYSARSSCARGPAGSEQKAAVCAR